MTRPAARILVADDDADIRDLIATKLELGGYEVRSVADGDAALAQIRLWEPDVAVLDIAMPGTDGLDVLREVRRDPEVSELRVVMLTARATTSDSELGLTAGADVYVFKPFSPADLLHRVEELLAS